MAYGMMRKPMMKKKPMVIKRNTITESKMKKLKEHSKKHGGMSSKHMKNMIRLMKSGMSFTQAHKMSI